MIPAGVELFASDAAFLGFLPFQQLDGQTAQRGQVFGVGM